MKALLYVLVFCLSTSVRGDLATDLCHRVEGASAPPHLPAVGRLAGALPEEFVQLLKGRGENDLNHLKASWVPTGHEDKAPDYDQRTLLLRFKGEKVGGVELFEKNGTLRFDIKVEENYEGTKLYAYLLKQALDAYPGTKAIPAHMNTGNSKNARLFATDVFGGTKEFFSFDVTQLEPGQGVDVRTKILKAMYDMPGIRARERNGFGKITKVTLDPTDGSVAFVSEKGSRNPDDQVKIYVQEQFKYYELSPRGQATPITDRSVLSLGDYYYRPDVP